MGPDVVILLLALGASLGFNGYQYLSANRLVSAWKLRARDAEDARHAQEIRSAEQLDTLLDRISTSPRIEVRPPAVPKIEPDTLRYIPDTPEADEAWNEFKGVSEDELT